MSRDRHPLSLIAVAAILVATVVVAPTSVRRAAAAANVQISQSVPGQTLIGSSTSITATITNPGSAPLTTTAFNLALAVRLPVGVSVSSADQPPTRTITETDSAGTATGTVVVWENIVDVRPGALFEFQYTLTHVVGTADGQWQVGEVIDTPITAYVSDDDAIRPTVQPSGTTNPISAVPADFDDSTSDLDDSTTLVPLLLEKSEPSPEADLLRGVHDHQTVFTLTARTGSEGGVGVSTVDDWIPAGLEFLGCGTVDNSSPGEEYPGSGPLNPGNAPAIPGVCVPPTLVETVADPAGRPAGVYTHVQWAVNTTLAPSSQVQFSYVAGIPLLQNTTTWPNGTPTATSGLQASNLDNNNPRPRRSATARRGPTTPRWRPRSKAIPRWSRPTRSTPIPTSTGRPCAR